MMDDAFWARELAEAEAADAADPLAAARARFRLPPGVIYLVGNSLGPAPLAALEEMEHAREEWAEGLIASWNRAGWFAMPTAYGDMLAPIIGASPGEVVACDTVSLNVFKCLQAAFAMRPGRRTVVAEAGSFPTDLYVSEGAVGLVPGGRLRLEGVDGPDLVGLIDEDVAAVLVNQVDYRTGRLRDLAALTAAAHEKGALAVWDLCHSAGAMEVGLNAGRADMAVGCSYKYLNGGPGAPGFVFAARRHHGALRQPLSGWWGHARPFAFERSFEPVEGVRRFLCGTQPILSMRTMRAGLALFAEFPMPAIRAKSMALTDRFTRLAEAALTPYGVGILSPKTAEERGSQVALTHPEGYAAMQALIARGVMGDFRAPDVMRFGFAPLYIGHADAVRAARSLEQIMAGRVWAEPRYRERAAVT